MAGLRLARWAKGRIKDYQKAFKRLAIVEALVIELVCTTFNERGNGLQDVPNEYQRLLNLVLGLKQETILDMQTIVEECNKITAPVSQETLEGPAEVVDAPYFAKLKLAKEWYSIARPPPPKKEKNNKSGFGRGRGRGGDRGWVGRDRERETDDRQSKEIETRRRKKVPPEEEGDTG